MRAVARRRGAAEVRQIAWTFERSDKALAELADRLRAERVACIEAAQ